MTGSASGLNIPPIPAANADPVVLDDAVTKQAELKLKDAEFRLLSAEASLLDYRSKEASQRYKIKWIAVIAGTIVIGAMMFMLCVSFEMLKVFPLFRQRPAVSIALIAVPTVSITSITIALFVGAFRNFRDEDAKSVTDGAVAGVNLFKGS